MRNLQHIIFVAIIIITWLMCNFIAPELYNFLNATIGLPVALFTLFDFLKKDKEDKSEKQQPKERKRRPIVRRGYNRKGNNMRRNARTRNYRR